ncbi:hypothetical protein DYBT9275_02775 [Dyadobacter sp. CECT 9275]|uniref:Uncharacterized protein n=1 Tax=Dyadobacter helix TaxID=2822344 RepID=A0A916JD88_9BACT|nr:hypothetical protein [Dyadobacter sp. CECT 9275]CAG5001958.1 hypothetical protein DYBT9275_02775 [Dyadobacter sp. CECT 9275]
MSVDTANENTEPVAGLIQIPHTAKSFEAGGHTYHVEDSLSIERYKAFQRMEIELGYGYNFSALTDKLQLAYQYQNERKFADVSVILYQLIEGAVAISEKKPTALYVATLFINRSDEDRTVWSRTIAEEKLKDWNNIDANFFLIVALSRVRNFGKSLNEISQLLESVGAINKTIADDLFPADPELNS